MHCHYNPWRQVFMQIQRATCQCAPVWPQGGQLPQWAQHRRLVARLANPAGCSMQLITNTEHQSSTGLHLTARNPYSDSNSVLGCITEHTGQTFRSPALFNSHAKLIGAMNVQHLHQVKPNIFCSLFLPLTPHNLDACSFHALSSYLPQMWQSHQTHQDRLGDPLPERIPYHTTDCQDLQEKKKRGQLQLEGTKNGFGPQNKEVPFDWLRDKNQEWGAYFTTFTEGPNLTASKQKAEHESNQNSAFSTRSLESPFHHEKVAFTFKISLAGLLLLLLFYACFLTFLSLPFPSSPLIMLPLSASSFSLFSWQQRNVLVLHKMELSAMGTVRGSSLQLHTASPMTTWAPTLAESKGNWEGFQGATLKHFFLKPNTMCNRRDVQFLSPKTSSLLCVSFPKTSLENISMFSSRLLMLWVEKHQIKIRCHISSAQNK